MVIWSNLGAIHENESNRGRVVKDIITIAIFVLKFTSNDVMIEAAESWMMNAFVGKIEIKKNYFSITTTSDS